MQSTFRNAALRVPVATDRPPGSGSKRWTTTSDDESGRQFRWRFTQGLILELFDRWQFPWHRLYGKPWFSVYPLRPRSHGCEFQPESSSNRAYTEISSFPYTRRSDRSTPESRPSSGNVCFAPDFVCFTPRCGPPGRCPRSSGFDPKQPSGTLNGNT